MRYFDLLRKVLIFLLISFSTLFSQITGDLKVALLRVSFPTNDYPGVSGNGDFLYESNIDQCGVYTIDPPPHAPAFEVKMTLVGGLPLHHPPEAGKMYLANLGIPKNIYKEVGIKFSSPFGAKFVIPLHKSCTT